MKLFRGTPLEAVRWVVIDCETSGLDAARDRLLSVGAVAVHHARVALADAFSAGVQQAVPSTPENIMIHGIGGDAQMQGRPLAETIEALSRFVGEGVPVGFHAAFDAEILRRHGLKLREKWLDLAEVAPGLFPERGKGNGTLDEWLAAFGIEPHARHDALGDAFATAQLLLVVLAEANRQRIPTVQQLKAGRERRWLVPT